MVAVWRTRELHKLAGVPAAALSAAHPDAYIQTGKKSMKGTEANGSAYGRSPTFSCLKTKQISKVESFECSWTEPYSKEILHPL